MKLVFTDPPIALPSAYTAEILALKQFDITLYESFAADEQELYERGKDAEVIIVDLTEYKAVLRHWPKLKVIITTSVGTDHIDVAYCAAQGIKVVNFPGYNARAVAEMAIAILISLLRKIPAAQQYALRSGWDYQYFEGEELAGKTCGVIGAGYIGREIIEIAQGFGMEVVACTAHPSVSRANELGIGGFANLHDVLKQSDFVVVAVPASAATKHMIGAKQLALMKQTAFLVNVSRGSVVDTLALAEALYEHKLAGAALDVIENEPFDIHKADLRIQEMVNANNFVLTPHIAFNTKESSRRLGERVVQELHMLA